MLASCFVIIQNVPNRPVFRCFISSYFGIIRNVANHSVFPLFWFFEKFSFASIDCLLIALIALIALLVLTIDCLNSLDSFDSLVFSVECWARGLRLDLLLALSVKKRFDYSKKQGEKQHFWATYLTCKWKGTYQWSTVRAQ